MNQHRIEHLQKSNELVHRFIKKFVETVQAERLKLFETPSLKEGRCLLLYCSII